MNTRRINRDISSEANAFISPSDKLDLMKSKMDTHIKLENNINSNRLNPVSVNCRDHCEVNFDTNDDDNDHCLNCESFGEVFGRRMDLRSSPEKLICAHRDLSPNKSGCDLVCKKCSMHFLNDSALIIHDCKLVEEVRNVESLSSKSFNAIGIENSIEDNNVSRQNGLGVENRHHTVTTHKYSNDSTLKDKKGGGLYICTICGRKFTNKLHLIRHRYHKHPEQECGGGELQVSLTDSETDKTVHCGECNKYYARKSYLARHRLKVHHKVKINIPNKINVTGTVDHMSADVLKSAQIEVNGSIIYHCKLCKKNIVTKRGYVRHVRIHTGERPFTCHVCGKQYRSSNDLSRHLRSVHDGIKDHECDICGKFFANKGTRNDHRRTHTGERPYICDVCGKAFPTANSIYVHRRIHTDYFPHQCTSCDKRFRRRQQLIHHVRTHTGEKPHACEMCGKCFGVKEELTRHLFTHSDEKPFACTDCGLCFAQKRYLKKHWRTQHSKLIKVS